MIHESVARTLQQQGLINEDKRYNTTAPELRPAVVKALRTATRRNRLARNKVPVIHSLDNGLRGGRTLEQLLKHHTSGSEREESVTTVTQPWWGDYILVGTGKLKTSYRSDAFTEHDPKGRMVPTKKPNPDQEHWDESTARGKDVTWTHLVTPAEDRKAQALARKYGLKPITREQLGEHYKPANKERRDRLSKGSSGEKILKLAGGALNTKLEELTSELEAARAFMAGEPVTDERYAQQEFDEAEVEEIEELVRDFQVAKQTLKKAFQSHRLHLDQARAVLQSVGMDISPDGAIE